MRHPIFAYDQRHRDNPSGFVVETLQAVFQALFATKSFESCLIEVVNRGGDADTTGAIAGMLAGACYGLAGIPQRWLKALDGTIRSRCEAQAPALLALAGCAEKMQLRNCFRNCPSTTEETTEEKSSLQA